MACHLIGTKPLSEIKFYRHSYIFIQENPLKNVVWKMAAIVHRIKCVNGGVIE